MPDNRIDPLTPATAATDKALAPVSPTGQALIGAGVWQKVAVCVVAVAGTVVALPSMGVALPAVVVAIATLIGTLGGALGIVSVGVRKQP